MLSICKPIIISHIFGTRKSKTFGSEISKTYFLNQKFRAKARSFTPRNFFVNNFSQNIYKTNYSEESLYWG